MNNLLQQNGASNVRRSARSAFGRRPGGRDWTHVRIATYSFLIVAWFASHAPNQPDAGVMLGDVRANGNIDATAVFANISGNDNGSPKGTALLDLLNDGGTGSFINNSNWKNTSGGMFSTAANGSSGDIYDLTDGTALGNLDLNQAFA